MYACCLKSKRFVVGTAITTILLPFSTMHVANQYRQEREERCVDEIQDCDEGDEDGDDEDEVGIFRLQMLGKGNHGIVLVA